MAVHNLELTAEQKTRQDEFRAFVDAEVAPTAGQADFEEVMLVSTLDKLIQRGYWGMELPLEYGGKNADSITFGLFNEELGRGCANLRNVIGVQGMVSSSILRWGTESQKQRWLPRLASGDLKSAFALTEPDTGSDAKNITTVATRDGSDFVLTGEKKWITFAQTADLLLVFAQCEGQTGAFLVEKSTPGLMVEPISGLLGFRGSMLARVQLDGCRVPGDQLLGKLGFGLSLVANQGLSHGRYSTAWGAVGLAQACLEASLAYASTRKQFGVYLREHQMIQAMIADMVANLMAAKLLCFRAGQLRENGDAKSMVEVLVAKNFASTTAFTAANNSVQIHGANGCSSEYPVQRYMRDAKILEIVEGSTQIQQVLIANLAFGRFGRPRQSEKI